ncbi:hypothetical protein KFU94_71090, partial [Chloroflexi bacterium TSY]|nr:hypothetical protein [Chloroflexi bacterium TSY]
MPLLEGISFNFQDTAEDRQLLRFLFELDHALTHPDRSNYTQRHDYHRVKTVNGCRICLPQAHRSSFWQTGKISSFILLNKRAVCSSTSCHDDQSHLDNCNYHCQLERTDA